MTITQLKERHYEIANHTETVNECTKLNTNISIQFTIEQLEEIVKPNTGFLFQNLINKINELKQGQL